MPEKRQSNREMYVINVTSNCQRIGSQIEKCTLSMLQVICQKNGSQIEICEVGMIQILCRRKGSQLEKCKLGVKEVLCQRKGIQVEKCELGIYHGSQMENVSSVAISTFFL